MASGDTLLVFTPLSNEPPASNAATPDLRGDHPVLDFDPDGNEEACWTSTLPRAYAGGGLTVVIAFMMTSATTGTVRWEAGFERHDSDLDTPSFAAFQSNGTALGGAAAGTVLGCTITFTNGAQMDSLAVGNSFRLKVRRDGDGTTGTDDASGDAELVVVEVFET